MFPEHSNNGNNNGDHYSVIAVVEDQNVRDEAGERFMRIACIAVHARDEIRQIENATPNVIFIQRGLSQDAATELACDLSTDYTHMKWKEMSVFIRDIAMDLLSDE